MAYDSHPNAARPGISGPGAAGMFKLFNELHTVSEAGQQVLDGARWTTQDYLVVQT